LFEAVFDGDIKKVEDLTINKPIGEQGTKKETKMN